MMDEPPLRLAARGSDGGFPEAPQAHTDVARRLFGAVQNNEIALAIQLVDSGADPNSVDEWGETPLFEAAAAGHGEVLKELLLRSADPGRVSLSGHTARDLAADAATRALLVQPPGGGGDGEEPLLRAVRASDLSTVLQLMEQGANPNRPDATGETALSEAAAVGDLDVCAALLVHRADPSARSRAGLTASDLAASDQVLSVLGVFSGGKADDAAGQAALAALGAPMRHQVAAWFGPGAAREEPRAKVGVVGAVREPPRTPAAPAQLLLDAAQSGDLGGVLRALGSGADPNQADEFGETPLFEVVAAGNADLTAALLLHKADPARRSTSGMAVEDIVANGSVRSLLCLFAGMEVEKASMTAALDSLSDPVREMVAATTKLQIGVRVAEERAPTQKAEEVRMEQREQGEQGAPREGEPAQQAALEEAPRGEGRMQKALHEGAPAERADPEGASGRQGGDQRAPQERAPAGRAAIEEASPTGALPDGAPARPSALDELPRERGEQRAPQAAAAQILEEVPRATEAEATAAGTHEAPGLPGEMAPQAAAAHILEEAPRATEAEAAAGGLQEAPGPLVEERAPQAAAAQILEEAPGATEAEAAAGGLQEAPGPLVGERGPHAAAAQIFEEAPGATEAEAAAGGLQETSQLLGETGPHAAAAQILEEAPAATEAEAAAGGTHETPGLLGDMAPQVAVAQILEEAPGATEAEAAAGGTHEAPGPVVEERVPQVAAAQILEEAPRATEAEAAAGGFHETPGPLGERAPQAAAAQILEEAHVAAEAKAAAAGGLQEGPGPVGERTPQAAAAQILEETPGATEAEAAAGGLQEAPGPPGETAPQEAAAQILAEAPGATEAEAVAGGLREALGPLVGAGVRVQPQPARLGDVRGPPEEEREHGVRAQNAQGEERPGAERFALGAVPTDACPATRSGSESHEFSPQASGLESPSAPGEERPATPPAEARAQAEAGRVPLAVAARAGAVDDVLRLLREGADPNATDAVGETPLFEAAAGGSASTVAALLLSSADPFRESQSFGVARDYAASGEVEALICLFEGREVPIADRQAALDAVAPGLREEVIARLRQEADVPLSLLAAGAPLLVPLSPISAPVVASDARRLFRAVLDEEGEPMRPQSAAVGALLEVFNSGQPIRDESRRALGTLDPETVRVVLTAALLHLQDNGLDMTVHPDLLR